MPTIDRHISQGADDGLIYWTGADWVHSATLPWTSAGYRDTTRLKRSSWHNFPDIQMPQGAIILEAHLTLICQTKMTGSGVRTKIRAVAEDNPTSPTSANDYLARALTTAEVLWDNIPVWELGQSHDSPDIKSVIQEIVNRENWLPGNKILIYWDDRDDRSNHTNEACRTPRAYEFSDAIGAYLHIEYEIPPTVPEIETLDATGIKSDEAMLHTKVVDDMGKALSVRHNYGKTTAYGMNTPWEEGKHTNDVISQKIIDLDPETEYHFRGEAVFED